MNDENAWGRSEFDDVESLRIQLAELLRYVRSVSEARASQERSRWERAVRRRPIEAGAAKS